MAGKPERAMAKIAIQFDLELTSCAVIDFIMEQSAGAFRSRSQLIELVIFLAESDFAEDKNGKFPRKLQQIKANALQQIEDLTKFPESRIVHATIDVDAVNFVDKIIKEYPVLFNNRSEALSLFLLRADALCKRGRTPYLVKRLNQVKQIHPTTR